MIEILNGTHETVAYRDMHGIKLLRNQESENFPVHWHAALEIIAPVRNGYEVRTNGVTVSFRPGDLFLIPPGELHALHAPEVGERLILQFDYALFGQLSGMDSLLHMLRPYRLITAEKMPELSSSLLTLLTRIAEIYESDDPFREPEVFSLLLRFFITLGRTDVADVGKFPELSPSKQQEYIEKFMSICNYINDHCTEDLSIDRLARMAGFSKYHFSRLFRQFTGISCHEYLIGRRLAYAENLLLSPDLSVAQVAMRSGFNSLSAFNRIFKSRKACTPSSYRSLNRGALLDPL